MWLIFWAIAFVVLITAVTVTLLLGHLREVPRRERLVVSSVAFFVTFFRAVRAVTHWIRSGTGGLHDISARGIHTHHLVWGIGSSSSSDMYGSSKSALA